MVYISIPFTQVDILFRSVRMFILFFTWYHLTFIISSFCTDGDWFFFRISFTAILILIIFFILNLNYTR